jgi:hypothetical protein
MKMATGMSAVLALAISAGMAGAQCTNYTRSTGTGSVVAGVTDIGNHGDDVTTNVALPFPVTYYGVTYNSVNVCSNGWISFTANNTGYGNVCLADNTGAPDFNTVPGATIFGHWDDLTTAAAGNGIFTSVTGAPGSQEFHIEWRTARLASAASRVDFEMRLFENSSRIEIIYGNITESGLSATSGIQASLGTFDQFSCNETTLVSGSTLIYTCDFSNPSGVLNVTGAVGNGATVLATVAVTPAQTPPSTGITVTLDASQVGGASNTAMFDNGTNGDVTAGDNVYSRLLTLGTGYADGQTAVLTALITDAQARSASPSRTVTFDDSLPGTATPVDGSGPVTQITGTLGASDADMYRIHLCEPANFSASTVGGTTMDTQLWLFRADGTGITMDDDDPTAGTTHLQSLLSSTYTASLAAGDYYLAISQYDKDAVDASNQALWLDLVGGSYRVEHTPDGPGAANPLVGWDAAGGAGGTYTINLTGVSGTACGPTCGTSDFNGDGDFGTDQDIEAFFACLAGVCCSTCFPGGADFNGDGDTGTDQDIEAFFRVLAGNPC